MKKDLNIQIKENIKLHKLLAKYNSVDNINIRMNPLLETDGADDLDSFQPCQNSTAVQISDTRTCHHSPQCVLR